MYLGHGFYVKWAGVETRGFVSSREAKEYCPELVIKFYQSRATWNDKKEVVVNLQAWALDLKVKLLKKQYLEQQTISFRTMLSHPSRGWLLISFLKLFLTSLKMTQR